MAQIDTFICGGCQQSFHDINLFIVHKNSQCEPENVPQEQQQVYAEVVQEDPGQQAETITVIQQVHADGTIISEDQVNESERQMCLIEVNEPESASGITSEIHLVPLQRVFNRENLQHQAGTLVNNAENVRIVHIETKEEDAQPPTKKRRPGRPRKGEEKTPKVTPIKKEAERPEPEIGEDGKYRCPRCKKTFAKERHFMTHRCLATTDYVDTLQREVLSPDEAEEEEEEEKSDKSVNFKMPGASRRGRPPKNRSLAQLPLQTAMPPGEEGAVVPPGGDAPVALGEAVVDGEAGQQEEAADTGGRRGRPRAQDSKKIDIELPISKESIANIPVFADEEEKLEFEESLNVDLSEVDSMYKTHIIDQNVNEHAPPPASRTSSELSVFSCNACDKVFKTLSHMRLHCLTHTTLKPFKCTKCSYDSNSKGNLYTHMRIHTGQFYTCPACNFQTPNKTHLVEHMATHSKVRHKCALCKKDYNTLKSMMNHVRKYHTTKAGREYLEKFQGKHNQGTAVLHQCHICLRKFKKKIDRDRHLFVHNIRGLPNIHECDLCEFTATRRRYLEEHFAKHRVVYVCAECGGKYPSSVRLNQHLNEVHGVSDASENWMEIFQACVASSLYLPEPDGSTDNLFDVPSESEQASSVLQVNGQQPGDGQQPGQPASTERAVLTEAVETDSTVDTIDQANTIDETGEVGDASGMAIGLIEEEQSITPRDEILGLKEDGTAEGQMEVNEQGQEVPQGQEFVEGQEVIEGQEVMPDEGGDEAVDSQELEATEELEHIEDYDIYKRLKYSHMSWDVFHKLRMTFGTEECEFCGRLFFSKSDYNTHFRSHTGERPFPCDQCTYRASTKDTLKRHVEKEHDKVTYVCQECEFLASSRTQLWHHQQRHKEPQELKCTECDTIFSSTKRLKAHLSVRHPALDKALVKKMLSVCQKPQGKLGRRSHKCPYCPKSFMRGSAELQKHIWIHQGIKPFKCSMCNHACRSKNNLMSHMMRHSADKPFSCKDCGKAYKSRTALRWHVKTHKEGKIFRCVKCNYEAVQYSHLKRHMQTHDVVKRFVCQHCNYSANTIGYMKIHYTRHHKGQEYKENPNPVPQMAPGTKVYRCLSCEYLFGNLSDIKRHLKVRHHVSVEDIHALDNIESDQPQTLELQQTPVIIQPDQAAPIMVQPDQATASAVEQDQVVTTMDVATPREDAEQHVPQSEVQVVEMMDPSTQVTTSEEQDASTALQALRFGVPQGNMDPQTASAVSILQQIIGMSKQGAFGGQQQITVQSEDGRSYVAVHPDTIIVQDSDELVIAGDGQEGEQQYVIQYVTAPDQEDPNAGSEVIGSEVIGSEVTTTEVVAQTEGQHLVDQQFNQVVEMEMTQEYVDPSQENMHVIMEGLESGLPPDTLQVPENENLEVTQTLEEPQTIEVPQASDVPQTIEVTQPMEVPHTIEVPQTLEVPQTMEVHIAQTVEEDAVNTIEAPMPETMEVPVHVYANVEDETTIEEQTITTEVVEESPLG